jgi:hypothetical protein
VGEAFRHPQRGRGGKTPTQRFLQATLTQIWNCQTTRFNRDHWISSTIDIDPSGRGITMSWLEFHTQSEKFASQAESLCHQQDSMGAVEFYRLAAAAEKQALDNLDTNKTRTLGITVVSAASLYFKAKDFSQAKELANQWLQSNLLPSFAIKELRSLLLVIYDVDRSPELLAAIQKASAEQEKIEAS